MEDDSRKVFVTTTWADQMPRLLVDGDGILTLRCWLAWNAFGRLREKQATQHTRMLKGNAGCQMPIEIEMHIRR